MTLYITWTHSQVLYEALPSWSCLHNNNTYLGLVYESQFLSEVGRYVHGVREEHNVWQHPCQA